ncbi:energy transducer TonB [bacterium SCSIO 12643]|nr:energy transducer TonB [bacterium SCSIO 12643]
MKKSLLLVFFSMFLSVLNAEEIYSPDINGLYEAPLIITCSAITGEDKKVSFTVRDVLKNTSGKDIVPNSAIKFHRPRYGPLGGYVQYPIEGEFVVYLRLYNGEWACYGGSQQVHKLKDGKIPFVLNGKEFLYTADEFKHMRSEFTKTFRKEGYRGYGALMTKERYWQSPYVNAAVFHLYQSRYADGLYYAHQGIPQPPDVEEPKESQEAEDNMIYTVVEEYPKFPGGEKELYEYLRRSVDAMLLDHQQDITGKIYVQFVIEKDGSVSQTEVIRGINKEIDQEALRIIQNMPNWTPGKYRGKVVRMYYALPIRIETY